MIYATRFITALVVLLFSTAALATAAPDRPIRVPFTLDSNLPVVRATVSGKPVSLILDLGGFSALALTKEALRTAPVKFSGMSQSWRNAMGQVFTTRLFTAPDLDAGELKIGTVNGIELASQPGANGMKQDGYIGFGLLRHYLAVFDYPDQELRLYTAGSAGAMKSECGDNLFHIDIANGVVQSRIVTDKGQLIYQWDTGSSESMVRPSVLDMTPSSTKPVDSFATFRFLIGSHDFGRTRLTLREFAAPNVDGVLGTDFLESKTLCIDVSKHLAAIK